MTELSKLSRMTAKYFVTHNYHIGGFHCHTIKYLNQNHGMSEAKNFRYYRISIN